MPPTPLMTQAANEGLSMALADEMYRPLLAAEARGLPAAEIMEAAAMVVGMLLAARLRDGPSREVAVQRLGHSALQHATAYARPRARDAGA